MNTKIERNYLEIYSLKDLVESNVSFNELEIKLIDPPDYQLNKFFYKNIGKKHRWIDRLIWDESKWIEYTTNKNVKTYILKKKEDLVGYFELIFHQEKKKQRLPILVYLKNIIIKN